MAGICICYWLAAEFSNWWQYLQSRQLNNRWPFSSHKASHVSFSDVEKVQYCTFVYVKCQSLFHPKDDKKLYKYTNGKKKGYSIIIPYYFMNCRNIFLLEIVKVMYVVLWVGLPTLNHVQWSVSVGRFKGFAWLALSHISGAMYVK